MYSSDDNGNTNVSVLKPNQGSSLVVGDVGGICGLGIYRKRFTVVGNDVIGSDQHHVEWNGQASNAV